VHDSHEVDGDHAGPVLVELLVEGDSFPRDPGIVYEDIDWPEIGGDGREGLRGRRSIGDIDGNGEGAFKLAGKIRGRIEIKISNGHAGTCRGQATGDGLPNSGCAAGNDGNLAVKVEWS
jgi:hypothetical protein